MLTIDSPEFIEIVIKHLIMDRATFQKAKDLKISVDDFGDPVTGIRVYREFVGIVLEINNSPIAYDVFINAVGTRLNDNKFTGTDIGQLTEFIAQIYNTELSSEYVVSNLPSFFKLKRGQRLQMTHKSDLDTLAKEYAKLVDDITISDAHEHVQVINPFESIVRRSHIDFIPTGLTRIDAIIQGFGVQEMALVMAASGGGKTTAATVFSKNAATSGKKVLYLSLEEPAINVTQRFYANVLQISYTNLYRGVVEQEFLQRKLDELDSDLHNALINNLRIFDLRDVTPLAPSTLNELLLKYCEENDFWPDEIVIDQLEFMKADNETKSNWEMYESILLALFKLTSGLLGGRKAFALIILHQLTDMRLNYTSKEIAGFKGAMRKCGLVIVIGRKNANHPLMNIHSLKARHSPNFELKHEALFETMDIKDEAPLGDGNQRQLRFSSNDHLPVVSSNNELVRTAIPVEGSPLPPNPITN